MTYHIAWTNTNNSNMTAQDKTNNKQQENKNTENWISLGF